MGLGDVLLRAAWLHRAYAARLARTVRSGRMPEHIALILDGNRRWAEANMRERMAGHRHGADAVESLLDWCDELGIRIVTLYALSVENMGRRGGEVGGLLELIRQRLEKLLADPRIHERRMRIKAIGRQDMLPGAISGVLARLEEATAGYERRFLNIAIAYGGRDEMVDAVRKIAAGVEAGRLSAADIDKRVIEENLYTAHLPQPSPDMVLRTSGERRLSGFLLWQSAYSELVFADILWPEFRKIDLLRAIRTYQLRKRRGGG